MSEPDRPRLLALRALGLGDLLTGVPALRALGRAFPDHHRLLALPAALAPIVEMIRVGAGDSDPAFRVLDHTGLRALPRSVRGSALAVNLHGRGPHSHHVLLATRPQKLIAFGEATTSSQGPRWRSGEHDAERWCRLLRESGITVDSGDLRLPVPTADPPGDARGATLIHPGASTAARRWPPNQWVKVARNERARGRPVVITGSARELPIARLIAYRSGLGPSAVLAGRTDLGVLAAAVAAADRVVCGDTGVGHLAVAMSTPSVTLFGPSPPAEWGPPMGSERHRAIWSGTRGERRGRHVDPGLLRIGPNEVIAEIDALPRPPTA